MGVGMITVEDLAERFVYKADTWDEWTILSNAQGPLYGDCDDFANTALWIEAKGSVARMLWLVLTFQAMLWYTQSPNGEGHYMLWRKGKGWIDNWYPQWGKRKHPLIVPFVFPLYVMAWVIKGLYSNVR